MSYDPNNVFAKILREETPAHFVYSDDHSVAFMDLMPQSDGHTLVVPRAFAENIFDLDEVALGHVALVTKKVAHAVQRAFEPDGLMIAQLNGAAAGQTVFHLHFHIIPRYGQTDLKFHAREVAADELLANHAARVRAAL